MKIEIIEIIDEKVYEALTISKKFLPTKTEEQRTLVMSHRLKTIIFNNGNVYVLRSN